MSTPATEPFSLLLPVYAGDDAGFVARAVTSATTEQTLQPDEVVIVRDGPVPSSLQAVLDGLHGATFPVRILELADNRGIAAALTAGLAACRNDIVARMDADDIAVPERFARQLALMSQGHDMVGSGMFEFADDEDEVVGQRVPPLTQAAIEHYARFHDPFNHPTIVYRKSAVQRAGGYVAVGLMEDYWLWARMRQAGARVANLPDPLVKYRIGAGAYKRRGGLAQLVAEVRLQRLFRRTGFTTRAQYVRNLLMRGGYRLLPEAVRRTAYRALVLGRQARRNG